MQNKINQLRKEWKETKSIVRKKQIEHEANVLKKIIKAQERAIELSKEKKQSSEEVLSEYVEQYLV